MGDDVGGDRRRQQAGNLPGNPFPAFAGPALFGGDLLHRLQGQLRRIQGDGARPLWRVEIRKTHPGSPHRLEGGWLVPPRPLLFRLLHRLHHDQRTLRKAVRPAGARPRSVADAVPHGRRGLDAGGAGRSRAPDDAQPCETDRIAQPVPRRRCRAQLRRQRKSAARRVFRQHLDPAGRGRRRRRGGRRPLRLSRLCRQAPQEQRRRRHGRRLSRPSILARRDRAAADGGECQVRRARRSRDDRRHRTRAGRSESRGLVPGTHGVRPALARRAIDPRRCALARDAEEPQSQGQVPRKLPTLRARRAARGCRRMVRPEFRQPLYAHRRRRARGSPQADERRGKGAVRHRQAERVTLGNSGGDACRLLRPHPDRAPRHQSPVPPPADALQGADRMPRPGQHQLQRPRRADRLHAGRRLPLLHGQ